MIIEFHGFPGAGKSTVLSYIARQLNSGKSCFGLSPRGRVFSSFPLPNCYKLEPEKLGFIDISNATLLIDEISSYWDNRNFQNFLSETMMYFKLSRHYGIDVAIASQSVTDADKKIRQLVQMSYIVEKIGCFSFVKPIEKIHSVSSGVPVEKYRLGAPLSWSVIYRPALYADFDSYQAPSLPSAPAELWNCSQAVSASQHGLHLLGLSAVLGKLGSKLK